MDVPTLNMLLRPIFTVTAVWNTGETGDINNKPVANFTKKKREEISKSFTKNIRGQRNIEY